MKLKTPAAFTRSPELFPSDSPLAEPRPSRPAKTAACLLVIDHDACSPETKLAFFSRAVLVQPSFAVTSDNVRSPWLVEPRPHRRTREHEGTTARSNPIPCDNAKNV